MQRTLRIAVVGVLVLLMAVNPATAYQWFGRCGGYYRSYYRYPVAYYSCSPCASARVVYYDGCCCGGVVVERVVPDSMRPTQQPPQQPATVNRPAEQTPVPRLRADEMMQPAGGDTESAPTMPRARTPVESTAPVTRPGETATPFEELFGPAPGGDTPPTTEMPAAGAAGAGGAAAPTTPTPPPDEGRFEPTTPATSGGVFDELFGPGGGGGAAMPTGGATDTTPTATDATDSATTETGTSEPATTEPTEGSLFGTGGTFDDIFGTGGGATPAGGEDRSETPAGGTPATDEGATRAEGGSPFDFSAVLLEAGGLASDQMREWVDNTGRYTTRGRLLRFLDGHVRLLKENGHTTTVPLYRLSQNDLEFVHRQASAQRATQFNRTVQMDW